MAAGRILALFALLLLVPSNLTVAEYSAREQPGSVRSLYDDCSGRDLTFCHAYLLGVSNALDHQRDYDPKWNENYCPPVSAAGPLMREIFVKWAERSGFWTADAYDGVLIALAAAHFCTIE